MGAFFVNSITIWVLYPLAYHIGQFILSEPETAFIWEKLSFSYIFSLGRPFLLGAVVLGVVFSVIFYFIAYSLVVYYRKRKDNI